MKKPAGLLLIISTVFFVSPLAAVPLLSSPPGGQSNDDGFWRTVVAAETPLSARVLEKHIELCRGTGADSQIVVYGGRIVSEWYSERYAEPVGAMSSTKAIASILMGQLADAGRLDYDAKVSSILPAWTGGFRDQVTVRHLLTHTAGFARRAARTGAIAYAVDKSRFVLNLYPDWIPGTKFDYSNEGAQLLEPIISVLAGEKTETYAENALFRPIGANGTALHAYGGSAWLYAEMRTTARDLARIGLLMKNGGVWQGRRIVSEDYIRQATAPSPLKADCGFLWWILDEKRTVAGFYASGYLNTDVYVFSDYDVVIVRTQEPKNGFAGQNESGDYFRRAMPLFKQLVGQR